MNPLQLDPTQTTTLRRKFMSDLRRRFNSIAKDIYQLVAVDDVFGLTPDALPSWFTGIRPIVNAYDDKGKWKFDTNTVKLAHFGNWLKGKYSQQVLEEGIEQLKDKYWHAYILEGYKKGAGKAWASTKGKIPSDPLTDAFYKGGQAQFLQDAFAQPETIEKTKLLAGRVFTDLQGVTQDMATKMNRTLTDGLVQGQNPKQIAANLIKEVDVSKKRAETIARTEIIRAHAEGQLDVFDKLGVEEIGVAIEWSTAGDSRVCKLCSPLDGAVFKTKEAHGLIPRHPNCRCSFLPANIGEATTDQTRGKAKIEAAIKASVRAGLNKKQKTLPWQQQKQLSTWLGSIKPIDAQRTVQVVKPIKGKKEHKLKPKPGQTTPTPSPIKPKPKGKAVPVPEPLPQTPAPLAVPEPPKTPAVAPPVAPPAKPVPRPTPKPKPAPEPAPVAPTPPPEPPKAPEPPPKPPEPPEPPKPVKPPFDAKGLPTRDTVKVVSTLPGSTAPKLVEAADGTKWVMKEGAAKAEHLLSEALADDLYRTLGIPTPKSGIGYSDGKPVKFSEFLPNADPLGKWMKTAKPADVDRVLNELQDGFVADALLGNWDVAGLSLDNILVQNGVAYRIDNGGALLFRAQGAKKANWGAEVKELKTLLDPATNAQTAQIFGGITPERIRAQVDDLLGVRDALLSKIDDPSLRQLISDRLDWMNENVKGAVNLSVPNNFADLARLSRSNGRRLVSDKGDIEDMGLLVWEETDASGNLVTKISGKLTAQGGGKVAEALGDSMPKLENIPMIDPTAHPEDNYWDTAIAAIKTINAHAADGAYNLSKITALETKLADIETKLKAYKLTKEFYDKGEFTDPGPLALITKNTPMLRHYKKMAEEVLAAKEAKKATEQYSRYVVPKVDEPKEPERERKQFRVSTASNSLPQSRFENGRNIRTAGAANIFGGQHYSIGIDDVEIRYFPPSLDTGHRAGRALENTVDITIQGKVSQETIQKGQKAIEKLGIDPTVDEAHEELMYLAKGVHLMKKDTLVGYKKIIDGPGTSADKVAEVKDWLKKHQDIDVDKVPSYNPKGHALTFAGDGQHYWNRWDLTPNKVKEEMGDYWLTHNVGGGSVESVLDSMLNSGGIATSTVQRLRKGVSIAHGMSSQTDITTGGADFFFTRIRKKSADTGIKFKIERLARMDAVSYDGDKYGSMDKLSQRKTTIEGFQSNARGASNETIFKNGLSILDDIDQIVVDTPTGKASMVAMFKKHKIDKFPDGRSLEDVILTQHEMRQKL